jgi:TolB-like protein/Tfp pilus assembly protein PilF/DNA-binding winged helix-turn-helix (wHTH) protein
MKDQLLDGFYLQELLVEPLTGQVSGGRESGHLPPKSVEVLLCLAKQPCTLVLREEILRDVWADGNGSPEALSHSVSEIRHVLGDHAEDPVFIQTVPKRGYRLLCEPRLTDSSNPIKSISAGTSHAVADSFWKAMLRHGVVQASIAYLVFGWVLIQVADTTFNNLGLPTWSISFVTYTVVGGIPLVVLFAWFLEVAGGRMIWDRGEQSGPLLQGLERNYLAIVAAFGMAALGAGIYQYAIGFTVPRDGSGSVAEVEPALIPIEPNSIAVLQLLNIDGSDATKVFSDGLSEDVLDRLATIPGLLVSSRGDAWSLPANATSQDVRRRLRVAYFVEGSVRLVDDELRVIVQLINSETGFHLVSRSFNKRLQDFMAMQREITNLVVANLRVALPDDSQLPVASSYEGANLDAYVLYRRGRDVLNKPATGETVRESISLFRQSLAIDPDYAAAHAGLCASYTAFYEISHDVADIGAAEQACGAALSANSRLHMVHDALGHLYLLTGRTAEAETAFSKGLQINQKDVAAMLGLASVFRQQQRFDEAEKMLNNAVVLQPGNWNTINTLGNFLFSVGRYADAAAEYQKVVYLDRLNWATLGNLGGALMMTGDFTAARDAIERSLKIETNQTIYSNLGTIFYYLGEFEQSVAIHRQVAEMSPNSNFVWLNLADALYFAGERVAAHDAFVKSAELSKSQLAVNPSEAESLYLLAWARTMSGDESDASVLIGRAIAIAPNDPYAYYYDALLKTKHGDYAAATKSIKLAVNMGYPTQMLAAEPYLAGLHGEKEFTSLLTEKTAKTDDNERLEREERNNE